MAKPKKIQYNGDSKPLLYLSTCVNWLLDYSGLPFQIVIDEDDNGINIIYDDEILNGGD